MYYNHNVTHMSYIVNPIERLMMTQSNKGLVFRKVTKKNNVTAAMRLYQENRSWSSMKVGRLKDLILFDLTSVVDLGGLKFISIYVKGEQRVISVSHLMLDFLKKIVGDSFSSDWVAISPCEMSLIENLLI